MIVLLGLYKPLVLLAAEFYFETKGARRSEEEPDSRLIQPQWCKAGSNQVHIPQTVSCRNASTEGACLVAESRLFHAVCMRLSSVLVFWFLEFEVGVKRCLAVHLLLFSPFQFPRRKKKEVYNMDFSLLLDPGCRSASWSSIVTTVFSKFGRRHS